MRLHESGLAAGFVPEDARSLEPTAKLVAACAKDHGVAHLQMLLFLPKGRLESDFPAGEMSRLTEEGFEIGPEEELLADIAAGDALAKVIRP